MDAVKFFKAVNRLCKSQSCEECPVYKNDMCCMVGFDDDSIKSIEETISKVEQWAKEHPVKTRQSEFLKLFPKADLTRLLPCVIEKDKRAMRCAKYSCFSNPNYCGMCRDDYWNEEVDE